MKRSHCFLIIIFCAGMLAGGVICIVLSLAIASNPGQTPVPTATALDLPIFTPITSPGLTLTTRPTPLPTVTVTPIPVTPTPTSTATPTARPTATQTPTLTLTPRRMATGTFLKDSPRDGYGELTIKNELNTQDAVAVLTPAGSKFPLIAVYIRARDSFTIKGIRDGSYELYFCLGENWDDQQGRFTRNVTRERFEEPLSFETALVTGGVQYTSITVTLYEVPGGMAETEPVPEEEFPDLRH